MTGPLSGIRVLELGQVIAGPFCAQMLADYGADVIKVEPPGTGRRPAPVGPPDLTGDSLWWSVTARNKRSITIDLRPSEGQELVRGLAAQTDVLVENFRPGTLEGWGLGWEDLSAVRPELIMVRISGYGQTGPYARRAGYASIGEAMGGLRALTGYADLPPTRVGICIGDSLTGMFGAMGALAALEARRRTGRGQVVDASIFESVLAVTEALVIEYCARGTGGSAPAPRSGDRARATSTRRRRPGADRREPGHGLPQARRRHGPARAGLGPAVRGPPRPRPAHARDRRDHLGLDRTFTAEDLLTRLHEAGVPAGLVYEPKDMFADPHFVARDRSRRWRTPGTAS